MARWQDDGGATAIEYGLVAGALALAVVAGASLIGGQIDAGFSDITGSISNAAKKQDRGTVVVRDAPTTATAR